MNIIDFLYDNYLWIIAILVIAIFTIIGFIADKKSKGKNGKESINNANVQAKVVPTEVPTPTNINANMGMANNMSNNNYQNVNYNNNMVNNTPNLNGSVSPMNNMSEQSIPNSYVNGAVNPTTSINNYQQPINNIQSQQNSIPNNFTNQMATNEQNINQVNQMMPNENTMQGNVNNVMPASNQTVGQINQTVPTIEPMMEQTPVYNNQVNGNINPNMVVNSWDEPKPVNPVNINQGFNQNNVGNIPTNNIPNQIPIQESIPVNTASNNYQQPVNNMPNGNSVPGLNFMYGPSQDNNNNLQ